MKTLAITTIAALFVATGTAQASDNISRAEVLAELQQAQQQGLIVNGEQAYPVNIVPQASKTRAQVEQELIAAKAAGLINIGEATPNVVAPSQSHKSRIQVQNELREYIASGHSRHVPA